MFKAANKQSNEEVVILDPEWAERVDYLRELDRKEILVCPGCQQPVRVKAGQKKRWHFAHKHLQDCPLSYESAIVLEARAVLYQWLVKKFTEGAVTLERQFVDVALPRPVDCWVQAKAGDIAYWIIASQVKPQQRENLRQAFEKIGGQVNWVFLSVMLREAEEKDGRVYLNTTEREFRQRSIYDEFIERGRLQSGFSLHYLEPGEAMLTTFRSLSIFHAPQLYRGRKQTHKMSEMLVHPKTGEFVHPGEYEYLQRTKKQRVRIKKRLEAEERRRLERYEAFIGNLSRNQASPTPLANLSEANLDNEEAICILCEETKREWGFISETGKRICKDCYEGKSQS